MSVITPIVAVVLGILAIAVNRHFAGPKLFEHIIIVVVLVVVVVWLLGLLGLLDLIIAPLRT
jgi:ABC-type sugar transport system permease subunit